MPKPENASRATRAIGGTGLRTHLKKKGRCKKTNARAHWQNASVEKKNLARAPGRASKLKLRLEQHRQLPHLSLARQLAIAKTAAQQVAHRLSVAILDSATAVLDIGTRTALALLPCSYVTNETSKEAYKIGTLLLASEMPVPILR